MNKTHAKQELNNCCFFLKVWIYARSDRLSLILAGSKVFSTLWPPHKPRTTRFATSGLCPGLDSSTCISPNRNDVADQPKKPYDCGPGIHHALQCPNNNAVTVRSGICGKWKKIPPSAHSCSGKNRGVLLEIHLKTQSGRIRDFSHQSSPQQG